MNKNTNSINQNNNHYDNSINDIKENVWKYNLNTKPSVPTYITVIRTISQVLLWLAVSYSYVVILYLLLYLFLIITIILLPLVERLLSIHLFTYTSFIIFLITAALGSTGCFITYYYFGVTNYNLNAFMKDGNSRLYYIYFNSKYFLKYFNLELYAPNKYSYKNYFWAPQTQNELARQYALLQNVYVQQLLERIEKDYLYNIVGTQIYRIRKIKQHKSYFVLYFSFLFQTKKGNTIEKRKKLRIYNNISNYDKLLFTCNSMLDN